MADSTNIEQDSQFMNKYSRQIGAYGVEAMAKLTKLDVLIVGINGLGVEIAKNVVLAGPRSVTIHDPKISTKRDMGTNFFINESNIGQRRDDACLKNLQELNSSVVVSVAHDLNENVVNKQSVMVMTEPSLSEIKKWDTFCRTTTKDGKPIVFIYGLVYGVCGSVFSDFGDSFTMFDSNGEEPSVRVITSIETGKRGYVIINEEDKPHNLSDDPHLGWFEISGVEGVLPPSGKPSINGLHKYVPFYDEVVEKGVTRKLLNTFRVELGDLTGYSDYINGGLLTQKKQPITIHHSDFITSSSDANIPQKLPFTDGVKFDYNFKIHILFMAILHYNDKFNSLPTINDIDKLDQIINENYPQFVENIDHKLWNMILPTIDIQLQQMSCIFGGIIAQEVIKTTGKYTPLDQFLYIDWVEVLPDKLPDDNNTVASNDERYHDIIKLYGNNFLNKLKSLKIFLAGCGALGCELLKNFALLGVGCSQNGCITITDNDNIEISNLNRQFLFRESNVGQPKATAAAERVLQMNPNINIKTYKEYIGTSTENIFNENFWSSLDCVVNALDNIPTRLYIDNQCVLFDKPLLESGTLSTKCNSLVVIPHISQSYSDGPNDENNDDAIPMCTLRNFPSLIDHCIEWARSLFNDMFVEPYKAMSAFIQNKDNYLNDVTTQTINEQNSGVKASNVNKYLEIFKSIDLTINLYEKRSFEMCVELAVDKFLTLFRDRILSLQKQFPEDFTTEFGLKFWSGAKRYPTVLNLNPSDDVQLQFIIATANIYAVVFGLQSSKDFIPDNHNWRNPEFIKSIISKIPPKEFVYQEVKLTETESLEDENLLKEYLDKFRTYNTSILTEVIDFEKDEDRNFHIDFIASSSNLRALNYSIPTAPRHKIKMMAGKILPAIATTTAMITGFDMMELFKLLQQKPLSAYKNSYDNLAINNYLFEEPPEPNKAKDGYDELIMETIKCIPPGFTKWDKTIIRKGSLTLKQFLDTFTQQTQLRIRSLLHPAAIHNDGLFLYDESPYNKKDKELFASKMDVKLEDWVKERYSKVKIIHEFSSFIELEVDVVNSDDDTCKIPRVLYYWK